MADRPHSSALSPQESRQTALGQSIAPLAKAHPEKSGIYALPSGAGSFITRLELAEASESTLDVQYYIWRGDLTGMLLFGALQEAAERGVRVRLLLDDFTTRSIDQTLITLHDHENIEVRLFNPFVYRGSRAWGFITDFSRANRRMHNKSFTADAQATIIGGRNIDDSYFGAADGYLFADLDVLAVGPVVRELSGDFDRYWVSYSAYPADRIIRKSPDPQKLCSKLHDVRQSREAETFLSGAQEGMVIRELLEGTLDLIWAPTRIVSDDPAKGLGLAKPEGLIGHQLQTIIGVPTTDVELVSPYFVPTQAGTRALVALAQKGVEVRVLTNSLDATNVPLVHSGYAKRRKALLRGGVTLYEMKRLPAVEERPMRGPGPLGSSGSSLHAKTFSVDRKRVFVGSFNFDPRSVNLNTELGLVIKSPELASQIEQSFTARVPENAYEVRLDDRGRLYWLEQTKEGIIRHDREPNTGFWQRQRVRFFAFMPIEWLL